MPALAVVQSVRGKADEHSAIGGSEGDLGNSGTREATARMQAESTGTDAVKNLHTV